MINPKTSAWSNAGVCDFQRPIIIDDRVMRWHDHVLERLNHVCRLKTGWDGYRARSVDFSTANFALRILQSVCTEKTPSPSIVPGINGDLQIEWHTKKWDVEIHVLAPNKVEAWRAPTEDQDSDGETTSATLDFTTIYGWVSSLAEPVVADFAAAA